MSKKLHSLKIESLIALIIAAAIAGGLLLGLHLLDLHLLDSYFESSDYVNEKTLDCAKELQVYVTENNLSYEDTEALNAWAKKQDLVSFSIYRDEELLYDSFYEGNGSDMEADAANVYYGGKHYTLVFSDAQTDLYLIGFFEYQFYNFAVFMEIILAIIAFVCVLIFFVQWKINQILRMEEDIRILESGGMEHEIRVSGQDELASLGEGLNQMRLTLADNMKREEALTQANNNLVTGMAHDLRTPLTTLLLYLELLTAGKYKNEGELNHYLDKSFSKAKQIKALSDELFERFLLTGERDVELEQAQDIRYVFEDALSDMMIFLESQGFTVTSHLEWPAVRTRVSTDYVGRILDNISSNLVKYADRSQPVRMLLDVRQEFVIVIFENKIQYFEEKMDSTNIGIPNMKLMMEKMGGKCDTVEQDNVFRVELWFPRVYH